MLACVVLVTQANVLEQVEVAFAVILLIAEIFGQEMSSRMTIQFAACATSS